MKRKQQLGAKMYEAFWGLHCHDPKQLFSKQALEKSGRLEIKKLAQDIVDS